MKKKSLLVLLPGLAMIMAGCGQKPQAPVDNQPTQDQDHGDDTGGGDDSGGEVVETNVTGINVAGNLYPNIFVGDTYQLEVTIQPATALDKGVIYSSDNEEVATVTDEGLITGIAVGQANIAVTAHGNSEASKTVKVTVKEKPIALPAQADKGFAKLESALTDGQFVVMAGSTSEKVVVMGTPGSNNIPELAASIESETLQIPDGALIFESVKNDDETFSFKTPQGKYIAATGTDQNNHLKVVDEINTKAKFSVTMENGVAKIVCVDEGTERNTLYYNSGNNIFSCYRDYSGNAQYQCVTLYTKEITHNLTGIELSGDVKTEYYVGESFDSTNLVVTAKYENGKADADVTASVTFDKTTLAKGDDKVVVSYTEGSITKTADLAITVKVHASGVTLDKETLDLTVNEADGTLVATVAPEDASNKNVTWESSDTTVATVNNGVVHAVAEGSATITVKTVDGEYTDTCAVTVAPATKVLSGISIETQPSKTKYLVGETFDPTGMVVQASYSSGHDPEAVTGYTYTNTALEYGVNQVTITYNGKTATVTILVYKLDSITITNQPDKTSYIIGETFDKTGMVVTANYTDDVESEVVTGYTVDETTALTKSDTKVTVSYTAGGETKTADVAISVGYEVMQVESKLELTAEGLGLGSYGNGSKDNFAWTDLAKHTSGSIQGNYKTGDGAKDSELHNTKEFSKPIKYVIAEVGYAITAGNKLEVRFGNDPQPTGNAVVLGDTDHDITAAGTTIVIQPNADYKFISFKNIKGATYFSKFEIGFETYVAPQAESVSLDEETASVNVGSTVQLTATVLPGDAEDKTVTWSTSDSTKATVSEGVVTGVAPGTVTITATDVNGHTDTCTVTVTAATQLTAGEKTFDLCIAKTGLSDGADVSEDLNAPTGITITVNKNGTGNVPAFYTDTGLRIYGDKTNGNGGQIKFAMKEGFKVSKVVLTYNSAKAGVPSINGTNTGAVSADHATDTVSFDSAVSEVIIKNVTTGNTNQLHIKTVVLTIVVA